MSTDLTFLTNEKDEALLERFKVLIKDTQFFDVLVGYFYTSGFHQIYKELKETEKIRILIGINTNKETYGQIQKGIDEQQSLPLSNVEAKEEFSNQTALEMEHSEDNADTEEGVHTFIKWIKEGKLEIKAYPLSEIHSKLYIMSFQEDDRDKGRVITGSSNFSKSGLQDKLEFNVELKNRTDYEFARDRFNTLWQDAVDVSEQYVETIQTKTWLNDTVTPYELYLKFLYEYFKDELQQSDEAFYKYTPKGFQRFAYQEQAILNAKKILYEYGGVFLSDVVGLGKTYMAAMLASQLEGRMLVLSPPVLLGKNKPGSWDDVFADFKISAQFESLGQLDKVIERGTDKYDTVIIDESHQFRNESTVMYEKLAQICRGKHVILVTATPYNNSPEDLLNQIKLFQPGKKSTIPNLPNLEAFFKKQDKKLKGLDRKNDYPTYIETTKNISREIRDKVLKYIMVRRTRNEIQTYFKDDMEKQGLRFPNVASPEPVFYQLNNQEDKIFSQTVERITKEFTYARYSPLLYYRGEQLDQLERQSQKNMGRFMRILLIKRLESSFYAFRHTVDRFIHAYERFLEEYNKGYVWVSKKHTNKVFELLENDDEEAIQRLVEEDEVRKYDVKDFKPELKKDLEKDLELLHKIRRDWREIDRDPKLLRFLELLKSDTKLQKNKLLIFTESKETAEYLHQHLSQVYPDQVLLFTGDSSSKMRNQVTANFDAKARNPGDTYRILVATEVLSEGVNLHASNIVINYDIPWNPTRLMQRVGRVNRVDTNFENIYTYTFFPTEQSNDEIKLQEAAEAKIQGFISLLGADAQLLTEGEEVESHELFNRITSKEIITGGEEEVEDSELKYFKQIEQIQEENPDLFEKVKHLPKKARTARESTDYKEQLLTYFRKGKLQKFYSKANTEEDATELDFVTAAGLLEAEPQEAREKIPKHFYDHLENNKQAFHAATMEPEVDDQNARGGGADNTLRLLKTLKAVTDLRQLTEEQEVYLQKVISRLQAQSLPKQTAKKARAHVEKVLSEGMNALKVVGALQTTIPDEFLQEHQGESAAKTSGPREVILSEYIIDQK